jgi:hypothetical protein
MRREIPWPWLRSVLPALYPIAPSGPLPAGSRGTAAAVCAVCRGPARSGFARCYQCESAHRLAPGLLADAVVPVSYAVRGTAFADDLWRYKSGPAPYDAARRSVLALLLAFLGDHGACVWRDAAMPAPDRLAVVPSGCGRPGPHPLLALASPYLRLPLWPLAIRPGSQGRDLDVHRFQAGRGEAGSSVLLVDDTWVSGASAQSAAAALKLAGAGRVAIVVLGRHVNPADPRAARLAAQLAPGPYDPSACAVHTGHGPPAAPAASSEPSRTRP